MTDRSSTSSRRDRDDTEPSARPKAVPNRSRIHDQLTAVPKTSSSTEKSSSATPESSADGAASTKSAATSKKPAATPDERAATAVGSNRGTPHSESLKVARTLNFIGKTLIGAGLIILLFVGYQLWGTNIAESRAQGELETEFSDVLDELAAEDPDLLASLRAIETESTSAQGGGSNGETTPSAPPATIPRRIVELLAPSPGEPIALIKIDKIGVEKVVVSGTSVDALRAGPGHYEETPLPGQAGNASIAGHRTTYGAPFNRLDELVPGDKIVVETVLGSVTYEVDAQPFVVAPTQVDVLDNRGDNRLTLTTCHPKFSAAKRLIVTATLVGEPLPALPAAVAPRRVETFATTTTPDFTEAPSTPTVPTAGPATEPTTEPTATTTIPEPASDDASASTVVSATSETGSQSTAGGSSENDGASLNTEGLAGDSSALAPAVGWGLVSFFVGVIAWALGRAWQRRSDGKRSRVWLTYLLAAPVFLFFLYLCFEKVDRLLPAY